MSTSNSFSNNENHYHIPVEGLSTGEFEKSTRHEWVKGSGVDPEIYRLNVEVVAEHEWSDGYDASFPIDEFLNRHTVRFGREVKRRDGYAWICRGLDPLQNWQRMMWGCAKLSTPYFDKTKGKARKYEHPSGTPTRAFFLDVPRHIWEAIAARFTIPMPSEAMNFWEWVKLNHVPIIITEGAKKAAALLTAGYVAIAIPGIWNARRVMKGENGEKLSEALIPELKPFLNGREFYFCFDREVKPKTAKQVALATIKTGNLLVKAGCKVFVCELPLNSSGKNGIDDFLVAGGDFDAVFDDALTLQEWQWNYRKSKALSIKPWISLNIPDLSAINLRLPNNGLIAIVSGKGTGKSKAIAANIADEDEMVIAAGHRICLMRDLCQRWNLDYRGDLDKFKGDFITGSAYSFRVGSCVDSLLAFNPEKFRGCTLVIDEAKQVVKHLLLSATCKKDGKRPALLARLQQLMKVAERVIIADADLDDRTIRYFQNLRGDEDWPVYLLHNDYKLPGYPVDFYLSADESPVIAQALDDALNSQKLFITTDSKALAEAIARELEPLGLKIMLVSSDTSGGDFEQDFIKHINEEVKAYDVVITTPSLATGVSIEAEHFDKVYGIYQGTIDDSDIAQSLMRVRAPIPRVVWVAERGNNFSPVSRDTYPIKIKQTLKKTWDAESSLIRASLQPDTTQFMDQPYSWDENPHLNLWASISADLNQSMWAYRESALARLRYEGQQITLIEADKDKGTKAAIKLAKEAIREAKCEAIALAPKLDAEERARLEKKEALKKEEREALEKAAIADFYVIDADELSADDVAYDDRGTRRGQTIELEMLLHGSAAAIYRDEKAIKKQARWEKDIWHPDLPKYELRRVVREKLGLDKFLIPGKEWNNDDLAELGDVARKCASAIKEILGITIPQDASNVWIFRRFLSQLGIAAQSKRIGKANQRICWIDAEQWERVQAIVTRRAERYASTEEQQLEAATPPPYIYRTGGGVAKTGTRMERVPSGAGGTADWISDPLRNHCAQGWLCTHSRGWGAFGGSIAFTV